METVTEFEERFVNNLTFRQLEEVARQFFKAKMGSGPRLEWNDSSVQELRDMVR